MTIGMRIKELRKKKDLTQERLADFLCVSYQAVSKWETGLSSPDISLIVPLARILGVTTDELLGASQGELDRRREELESAYNETFKTGDISARLAVDLEAIREFPDDMKWLTRYGWEVWCLAIAEDLDRESFEQKREEAIKAFDTVIRNIRNDDDTKVHAIVGITQCLCGKGCKAEAKQYAELYPDTMVSAKEKQWILGNCLEGEEQIRHKQKYLDGLLQELLDALLYYGLDGEYPLDAAEQVIKTMIPDGNYCVCHQSLCNIYVRKAEAAIRANDHSSALELLKKSVYHAEQFDIMDTVSPGEYRCSSPLFALLTVDSRNWYRTGEGSLRDDIVHRAKRSVFDPLRQDPEFKAIFG